MPTNFFYVYALKDPRENPCLPFYIGKGTGSRAFDHLARPDSTAKYARIKAILADGHEPIVDILVEDLTEVQALKLEAELISAFGTKDTGGILTNAVVPKGLSIKRAAGIVVPHGCVEQAQLGLGMLKDAVIELAQANEEGITNADVAASLGLRSDYRGRQKDYLSYSLLGLLLREGRLERIPSARKHTVPRR